VVLVAMAERFSAIHFTVSSGAVASTVGRYRFARGNSIHCAVTVGSVTGKSAMQSCL